jgi:lipoyl(octanoyl) transferase
LASSPTLEVFRVGSLRYAEGLEVQAGWVSERRAGHVPDRILLVEHPHVVTLGRGTQPGNLLRTPEELEALGIERFEVGRGGDVTYHGPGQLVGYPILDLKPGPGRADRRDLHRYLRELEGVLIDALADFGVEGTRAPGMTGVWTRLGKVAAIGVRVSSGWITSHGFALNLDTDLSYFEVIVPCGLEDRRVTTVARLLPEPPTRRAVEDRILHHLGRRFDLAPVEGDPAGVGLGVQLPSGGANSV